MNILSPHRLLKLLARLILHDCQNRAAKFMNRLIIVSNRLPINTKPAGDGSTWTFQLSSGGLVSALQGLQKTTKFLWIGWPGLHVDETDKQLLSDALLDQYSAIPVFIDEETSNLHYRGFSNSTIWPLFHYLPGDIDFNNEQWQGYVRANELFAERIASLVQDGDTIWVHDYHLMVLPKMLRERCKKNVSIGFFLHIPFPASDVYRALPYRREILEGLLAADLVGFHIYDYARHFIASCTRILGVNSSPSTIDYKGKVVRVGAYPVGIDPENFAQCLQKPETICKIEALRAKFDELKIIVGVERLDYIKGMTHKLLAFESFLETHEEFRGKVVLLQVAVPSRGDVEEYQNLQNQVFELVGRINGKFSSLQYSPVQFIHNSVSFEELAALYYAADVCLITSTRDGMNLVAYEYIAAQKQKRGVLILSEFAGAAQSLNGALLINPWCLSDIKNALSLALKMEENEKAVMHSHLSSYVDKFTAERWGTTFVADLIAAMKISDISSAKKVSVDALLDIASSKKILFLTTNDNNLCPEFIQFRQQLHSKEANVQFVSHMLSSNSGETLQSNDQTGGIILNYGSFVCLQNNEFNVETENDSSFVVPDALLRILMYYQERCPGSRIISTDLMIIWDFSECALDVAEWTSCELQINLEKLIGHQALKVTRDFNCIIITQVSFEFEITSESIGTLAEKFGAEVIVTCLLQEEILNKAVSKLDKKWPVYQLEVLSQNA